MSPRLPTPTPLTLALIAIAILAGAVTQAGPAFAAGMPLPGATLAAAEVEHDRAAERAAANRAERRREARQQARERRERRQDGPFHPLAGQPDYGTAENAFGASRSGHTHAGQDVFAPAGTPLVAVADATVAEAGSDGGRGNFIVLFDPERERSYVYMHMQAPSPLKAGDRVEAGERLGGVGCTGSCWGDHLHFEVHEGRDGYGPALDPLPLLRDWRQAPN